jgi:hypothetical protein
MCGIPCRPDKNSTDFQSHMYAHTGFYVCTVAPLDPEARQCLSGLCVCWDLGGDFANESGQRSVLCWCFLSRSGSWLEAGCGEGAAKLERS